MVRGRSVAHNEGKEAVFLAGDEGHGCLSQKGLASKKQKPVRYSVTVGADARLLRRNGAKSREVGKESRWMLILGLK